MASSKSSKKEPELSDLTGRVAIITGSNTGVGYNTCRMLARRGAKVYMAARNESKANIAIESLHTEGLGENAGEVIWLKLDLASPRQTKEAAEYILSHEQRLDILINNAAKSTEYSQTSDGLSENMVINHLSPFLFTNTLLPLMIATSRLPNSDVRIVNVSSVAHSYPKKPRFDTIEAFNTSFKDSPLGHYGYTKIANILYSKQLQQRLDAEGVPIIVISIHPGSFMTDGAQSVVNRWPMSGAIAFIFGLLFEPVERSGYNSAFAAASPDVRKRAAEYKGAYLMPVGKITKPSVDARNPQLALDLWAISEKQLAVFEL
ncbi:NAD(P)-binding protein [Athelia psychrophila]|uniref:NAD(P)-binding protein n=1 Tax=Athelia psychrophila TaxID=1759441 RepID=A0A165X567_9AGAM|nr:NAD(P)-binding protein [Fibularhizoctonia sp. CBS 109695]